MSGNDNLLMNTLERATSGDINDLQSLQARVLAELFRQTFSRRTLGQAFSDATRSICMGLGVTASGSDVVVGLGVLAQQSATLPPVPGVLDSTYRLARLDTATTITGPTPGANTWYLVEAQMVPLVTSTQVRDVYNPTTQVFVPTLVTKITVQSIAFQIVAGVGANLPAPSGGNWVPLAGVEWPAGGGAPLNIVDLRQLPDVVEGGLPATATVEQQRVLTSSTPSAASNDVSIVAQASNDRARLGGSTGVFDATSGTVIEPGTVFVADAWFYLYLAEWSALALAPQGAQGFSMRGVVVVSATPPVLGTATPSAAITPPAPFAIATTNAICIGAVRRNTPNTGWIATDESDRCAVAPLEQAGGFSIVIDSGSVLAASVITRNINLSTFVPRHATTAVIRCQLGSANVFVAPPYANLYRFQARVTGAGPFENQTLATLAMSGTVDFEWPIQKLGDLATISAQIIQDVGAIADIGLTTSLIGWRS